MRKITGLSHLFKWENLHNWWLTKYFFAPLYIPCTACLHIPLAHTCLYYYLLSPQYAILHILFYFTPYSSLFVPIVFLILFLYLYLFIFSCAVLHYFALSIERT